MGAMKDWAIEKHDRAVQLSTALAALIGAVDHLALTGAYLSWRTADGIQGSWREEHGQFWLGRIVTDVHGAGTQSEYLVLDLESVGDDDARIGLAHPTAHHCQSSEGVVVGFDPDTAPIYEAALCLLTQLAEEVRTLLPYARAALEERDEADER